MKNKKALRRSVILICLITAVITLIVYGNFNLEVTEHTLKCENLPTSFDQFKIVQLSDLHNEEFGEDNEKLLEIIKEQEPDVVFVTGDSIDGVYTNIQIPIKLFKEILEICDVYFIVGNHEIRSDANQYFEFIDTLTEIGIVVLKDDCAYIERNGEKIQVIGLNDASNYKVIYGDDYKTEIAKAISELDDENSFSVLLSHHPELFEEYVKTNVDLVFSGHVHGGQFRIPFIGGIIAPEQGLFPEFDAGIFAENNTTMIVSRGLGNSIIPIRINNSPEVVVVTLKPTD